MACTDTRQVGWATREQVMEERSWGRSRVSVDKVAWDLLDQSFGLSNEAVLLAIQFLSDDDAMVCAAALLLQNNSQRIPEQLRKEAAEKVLGIVQDDELSRRPLDTPKYTISRLDDVLFETLKVLGE